ncbi:TetR/AcrR family transcriptional regulator [Pseudomonas sp. GX19020]|uniref:TetR/AcrR family transcriptional regulator n=1 Tax=Pseudomonas sp. GX19020 TaxID=2942277 RepID=UPI00201975DC|nr:TetR/AcrR family transcriptional regulator [Pseudomonas sp. GX19020]MCL4067351.1 TetR/AcrR family transcriptional regulator [Pseudomonas sp. GX19020]
MTAAPRSRPPSLPSPSPPRRRQPEILRRRLLDAAAALAVAGGLQAMTIAAVARAAGVTKGGLFHHFPDKEALITALLRDLLDHFDAAIDLSMAADPEPKGSFTRAWIAATLDPGLAASAPLNAVLLMNPGMRGLWSDWLRARLTRHAATDSGPWYEILRHAADGFWLADLWQVEPDLRQPMAELCATLLDLTRRNPA